MIRNEVINMVQVYKTFPYRLYEKISRAVKISGTFKPSENMYQIEEELTSDEYEFVYSFLQWCHENGKTFGRGNYQEIYKEYLGWNYHC